MNIVIRGGVRSGKTLLMELLKNYYKAKGQEVAVIREEYYDSKVRTEKARSDLLDRLRQTRGMEERHTVFLIQPYNYTDGQQLYQSPSYFDYYINTQRGKNDKNFTY